MSGAASELLYTSLLGGGLYKVSELDYPLQAVFLAGSEIRLQTAGGLDVRARFDGGLNGYVGAMTDSDYLDFNGVKTDFSESGAYVERAILLDVRAGWDFGSERSFLFEPFAAFMYSDVEWEAEGGYYQYPSSGEEGSYPPWSPSEPQESLSGPVLMYDQAFLIPAVGVRLSLAVTRALSIEGSCAFSPFAFGEDVDNHLLTLTDYYDSMSGGIYFEPELSFTVRPLKDREAFEASLRLSYVSIAEPNSGTVQVGDNNPADSAYGTISGPVEGYYSGATFQALTAEIAASLAL